MTDPTYIAEIFGGPSQAIGAFSSLLQTISDQFTVSPSEQGKFTYKELEASISLIASGQVEVSTSSSSGASSFKAQGGPEKPNNSTKSTSSEEEALRTKCTELYRAVRFFEKLRALLVQAGALDNSQQHVNVFAQWGVAVPHNQTKIESGTSPWRTHITNILTPIVQAKHRHNHPANYDSRNGAFVFPIYSLKSQQFPMENLLIGEEKTLVSFSTLFEETITCGQSRMPTAIPEVMALFKVTITTASEVKSILNNIRDLATGFNSNTQGVFAKGGNFRLRHIQALNNDIKEANIPDIPADFASKPRQFAHQILRSIGYASHAVAAMKRGGNSFLTAGAAAAEEDESTTTADSDTNPSTQTPNNSSEDTIKIKSQQTIMKKLQNLRHKPSIRLLPL